MISIVSHLEKSEIDKYGKDIRLYCLKIQKQIMNLSGSNNSQNVQVNIDMRSKTKLSDKITL